MALNEGDTAPAIELPADDGSMFELTSAKGKNIIVYFYPKADTPGCTTEACEFRDAFPDFRGAGAVVLGVSPDAPKTLAKFKTKFGLPFMLLSDAAHTVAEAYGVWTEKSMYGRKYMGMERTTFLIGPDGKVRNIFRKVKAAGHAEQVLAALKPGV
ncbi:MAG TPA: thioredoxin-dependent thiol peroxidase [Bryobacteraceae bacterium]|nr:thioredoxin-dependent thiol peroxidase [Bryobacteraceae bacterium]